MFVWLSDVYVCMYVCIYLSMYVSMYVCMYLSMYVCMYVSIYPYPSIYLYTYVEHIHTRVCVHDGGGVSDQLPPLYLAPRTTDESQ